MCGRGALGELEDERDVGARLHAHFDPVGCALAELDARIVSEMRPQLADDRPGESDIDGVGRVEVHDLLPVAPPCRAGGEPRRTLDHTRETAEPSGKTRLKCLGHPYMIAYFGAWSSCYDASLVLRNTYLAESWSAE